MTTKAKIDNHLSQARRAARVSWHLLYLSGHDLVDGLNRRNVPKRVGYRMAADLSADVAKYLQDLSALIFLESGRMPEPNDLALKRQAGRIREAGRMADLDEEADREHRRVMLRRRKAA